jgi:hypothetical protein
MGYQESRTEYKHEHMSKLQIAPIISRTATENCLSRRYSHNPINLPQSIQHLLYRPLITPLLYPSPPGPPSFRIKSTMKPASRLGTNNFLYKILVLTCLKLLSLAFLRNLEICSHDVVGGKRIADRNGQDDCTSGWG